MKGTFREVIEYYAMKDLEFDAVIGDEDMPATYSFSGKPYFSPYCEERFGKLLNANATVIADVTGRYPDSVVVDCDDYEMGETFTWAWAGYVSESLYDSLFKKEG